MTRRLVNIMDMPDTRSEARRREIRLTRLRNIRRLAISHGDEALTELLDLMIEEEIGA